MWSVFRGSPVATNPISAFAVFEHGAWLPFIWKGYILCLNKGIVHNCTQHQLVFATMVPQNVFVLPRVYFLFSKGKFQIRIGVYGLLYYAETIGVSNQEEQKSDTP